MQEIRILKNSSVNIKEISKLYLKVKSNELKRDLNDEEGTKFTNYIERMFDSLITVNFVAYNSNDLIGWLGVGEIFPCTMLMLEFHPIIAPVANKKHIALTLIKKCIEYAIEKKVHNIRIFNDVTANNEERFLELEKNFLEAGMKKTHVVLCMENKISSENLKSIIINKEYYIDEWKNQTAEALTECYNRIFSLSFDNFTNSLDKEERKYWNTVLLRGEANNASIVVKKNDELVALILAVNHGDFIELGPIGVVPEHRGKKLGNILMEECLSRLIKQGKTEGYLEVDENNIPAINLYKSFGFFEVSKKHGFLWRK